ncbi:MAG: aldo/keto reductase [Opitutaceae bacterium]
MMDRRTFLRRMAAFAAASSALNAESRPDSLGAVLPTRALGRTGEQITAFTLGGAHVGRAESEAMAQKLIETAMELGCRSFDTARAYEKGLSEERYGRYLSPKYRDKVFIGTKTHGRTRDAVRKDLEASLRSMKVDHIDLWQIHNIRSVKDAETAFENGVVEEFYKAREEGLVRHIGFTGHRNYLAHLRFLELLKEHGTPMDTCLMPMNLVDPHYDSFIVNVMPKLIEENYGIFAMKTFAHGNLIGVDRFGKEVAKEARKENPTDANITPRDMHHYIYSLPVCSLVSGCLFDKEVRENIANLSNFKGMTAKDRDALIAKTSPFQGRTFEYYKA